MSPGAMTRYLLVFAALLVLGLAASALAQGAEEGKSEPKPPAGFGGPTSVTHQIRKDESVRKGAPGEENLEGWLASYSDFKTRLKKDTGLGFGFDYNALGLAATDSPGEKYAVGGAVRLFGQWEFFGRESGNTGSLVFKGEVRHGIGTELSPQDLGFEIGYAGYAAAVYGNQGWILTNFYWQQHLLDGDLAFILGVVDSTDYVNVYGLVNPWTDFNNLAFLNGATLPAPDQGLGGAVNVMLGRNIYLLGGIADANGDPGDPGDMFSSFFSTAEFFTHLELGWIGSYEKRYSDNAHVTVWHNDEREDAGTSSGWGANISWCQEFAGGWQPFVRAGIAEDGGALWERSITAGTGYAIEGTLHFAGLGLNWGRPSSDTLGRGLSDQYTVEAYCRLQVTRLLAVTPAVQVLINPALNPDDDVIAVFGLRVRLSF